MLHFLSNEGLKSTIYHILKHLSHELQITIYTLPEALRNILVQEHNRSDFWSPFLVSSTILPEMPLHSSLSKYKSKELTYFFQDSVSVLVL